MTEPTDLKYTGLPLSAKLETIIRLACEASLDLLEHPDVDTLRRFNAVLEENARLRKKISTLANNLEAATATNAELQSQIEDLQFKLREARANSVDRLLRERPRVPY